MPVVKIIGKRYGKFETHELPFDEIAVIEIDGKRIKYTDV